MLLLVADLQDSPCTLRCRCGRASRSSCTATTGIVSGPFTAGPSQTSSREARSRANGSRCSPRPTQRFNEDHKPLSGGPYDEPVEEEHAECHAFQSRRMSTAGRKKCMRACIRRCRRRPSLTRSRCRPRCGACSRRSWRPASGHSAPIT